MLLEELVSKTSEAMSSFEEKVDYWWTHEGVQIIRDFRFIIIPLIAVTLFVVIFKWARKHVPSKGRIIDMYDELGNKKEEKIFSFKKKEMVSEEDVLHDLPPEYYQKKKKK